MINKRKVIGLCLTKIHSTSRCDYVNRLHYLLLKRGYKLMVFNSFVDFYNNDVFDEGAKYVYDIINYDIIDALIILSDSFVNKEVCDNIASNAIAHDVPVVLVNGEKEGCFSVMGDYSDAFKTIINHVIRDHGVTDTYFIAGNPSDPSTQGRLACYKQALEENGLPFDETRVGYGMYWEEPTHHIIEKLLEDGNEPPRAIICANDFMAFAVCRKLLEFGYRVPEDVIVTGFDGVPSVEHFEPHLTTCSENLEGLAQTTVNAIADALENNAECSVYKNPYIPLVSESCGCDKLSDDDFRDTATKLFKSIEEMEIHEEFMYKWIDRTLEITDINLLYNTLANCALENSFICVNSDFLTFAMGTGDIILDSRLSDELIAIPSKYTKNSDGLQKKLLLSQMIPDLSGWANNNELYVFNAIYVGNQICGYYAVATDRIYSCKNKIKRVLKTINIAFNAALYHFKQRQLMISLEKSAYSHPITGLPNLKGTAMWFEEFSADPENHNKILAISVYGLPKYTYIYENYGIEDIENSIRAVAENLKMANPNNCYVAHIGEDEFLVINYFDNWDAVGDTINNATSVFYSLIEGFNANSGKDYYVEVNCGCTVIHPGWKESLASYIKAASGEMYMNRLKSGEGAAVKERTSHRQYYKAFELLLEKNLFNYHFQPIVNAKTGEIYAYEALMRTDPSIGLNPLQVLDTAKSYKRLYDIERATMFNVMERYAVDNASFCNRKVFINTIPGHFLNEEDSTELTKRYSKYMKNVVFELTEDETVSDEELTTIKNLYGIDMENQIAIDDYGTGHSNMVNLLRYTPHIIKIDRFLITDIHKNQNKQMFVSSTVQFAKMNNILVLAEGVETSNELRTVIDLGVDLIQGYYTGKPAPAPLDAISEDIRKEIIEAHPPTNIDRQ